MDITCEKFREFSKNSLRGFADLLVEPLGIRLHDCPLNSSGDSEWVGLPARSYQDAEGTKKWLRLVDFSTRSAYYEFQKSALEAIKQFRGKTAAGIPGKTSIPHAEIPTWGTRKPEARHG